LILPAFQCGDNSNVGVRPRPFLPVRDDEDDSDLHAQVEDLEEVKKNSLPNMP